jgi:2-methylisocitrate lyase-like PEP mutase family enzyme
MRRALVEFRHVHDPERILDDHRDKALLFRESHRSGRPLLLANAWDAASARVAEDAGAVAVALGTGTYGALAEALDYGELNALLRSAD